MTKEMEDELMRDIEEKPAQSYAPPVPPSCSTLAFRVQSNDDWLQRCENLWHDEHKRNGAYARELREGRGLSLREVARRMKISAMMLSDLERGNRNWTQDTLNAWENALNSVLNEPSSVNQ